MFEWSMVFEAVNLVVEGTLFDVHLSFRFYDFAKGIREKSLLYLVLKRLLLGLSGNLHESLRSHHINIWKWMKSTSSIAFNTE